MTTPADANGRFQFCLGPFFRLFFHRYELPDGVAWVYRWRLALGPFEIRRWSTLQAPPAVRDCWNPSPYAERVPPPGDED